MDWRLQGAALMIGIVLTSIPEFFASNYNGSLTSFSASWTALASEMQYLAIVGLIFAVLGILWGGPIGRASAWLQMAVSFGLGGWMLWALIGIGLVSIDFAALAPSTAPAQNVLEIGLLIPTLSFASSLVWLFRDGSQRAGIGVDLSSVEILRKHFDETSRSLVSAIVTPIMLIFGILLLFATAIEPIQITAAVLIGLSILVFVLEISLKKHPE